MSYPVSLQDLVDRAYDNSYNHGFWDEQKVVGPKLNQELVQKTIPEKLMLIVSEAAEALEAYREGKLEATEREDGKPEGFPSELADLCIRVFDLAGALDINLEQAIYDKMRHNESRPYKHGKVC